MNAYQIWSEGFIATGDYGTAVYHGTGYGDTFKEACKQFARNYKEFENYYDEKSNTYWGCRLYPNEDKARKTYG